MFSMTILAVGKLKERSYQDACAEYVKRLTAYCTPRVLELPEQRLPEDPSPAQIAAALRKEAGTILAKIPKGAWVCVLTPEGTLCDSMSLSQELCAVRMGGTSSACFILGGSFGLDPSVKARADLCLSMSPMTFPHHLARVMLLEQLYRAENIRAGGRYHK